ncbi:MAG: glycosyltransferase, partial [Candidatus Latescibacteria bacterium]|nr:glycosyltransferase [Candidatus Latescibacterota bacterium]
VFNNLSLSRIKNTLTLASKGDFRKIQQHIRELWKLYIGWNENKQKIEELDFCLDILVTPDNQKQKTDITSSVDIIIPVFNGIHLLERLFTSLFKNTRYPFNVIVVDDCSTDPVVRPFLEKIAAQYPNIKLIANQKNQGFVASVNLAARQAQNHFVILNTDVEVPTDWLSRLMLPIFNDDAIASTTPFTNAGTICSFPEQNMDNPLAYGLDLETIDQAFQYINSVKFTHEIPTGVGFCMGINKNVWQDIGEFDEILFGRGYGEENDWCMRASKRGYRNIIVTNLFVYHKHGGSFLSQEKRNLLAKNYAKLIDAHPDYPRLVHQFISDDPLFQTRLVARLMLAKTVASQTCLIFDHDLGGGTTVYRERLLQERVADGQTVFLLTNNPIQKTYKLEVVFQGERLIFTLNDLKTLNRLNQYVTIDEIICNSLVSYEDVPSVLEKIVELKLKNGSILSVCLHDFFLLCPSYTLLNHRGAYCDLPSIDVCDNCLPKNPYKSVKPEIKINLWRQKWSVLLGVTERVICFSKDSADILQRIYSLNDEQIIIRPHTLPHTLRKVKISSSNIRIGVVGGINYQKGYQIVVDTAKILEKSAPDAKIIIIGDVITTPDNKNIIVLGKYKPEELPDIVESYGINLAFFSSIWPETFSYVISELMQMELPICAFNLGAQAERLRAYSMAHLISRVDAGVAANEILEFHAKILGQKKILPD